MNIVLANPRGFCAGVNRAIEIVERALANFGAPVYVRHEVVHNRFVVEDLRSKGAVFVEELADVPTKSIVIFSAHGVSKAVVKEAKQRELQVFDATCPLVTKVHMEVIRYQRDGYGCVLIGHAGHPEVEGTLGQYGETQSGGMYLVECPEDIDTLQVKDPNKLAYVTQTTLSVDDTLLIVEGLKKRFPAIRGPKKDDICYATQNRQDAVKELSLRCDVVLVVGSPNSSNSNRLKEVAERYATPAYLIDQADQIDVAWLKGKKSIGITAGASAPDVLVEQVINRLKAWGADKVLDLVGQQEQVFFTLPKALR